MVDVRLEEMNQKFSNRGYPCKLVENVSKAHKLDRDGLLKARRLERKTSQIPVVSADGSDSGNISNTLRKYWGILQKGCPEIKSSKNYR